MRKLSIVSLIFIVSPLTACSPLPEGTVSQRETAAVAQMEKSGALPELDRSDSLGGVDADHNGIRDDIDAWIAGQHYSEPQKRAAQQFARAIQLVMTAQIKTREEARANAEFLSKALNCANSAGNEKYVDGVTKIYPLTKNTRERILKEDRRDRLLSGMVFEDYYGQNTCE